MIESTNDAHELAYLYNAMTIIRFLSIISNYILICKYKMLNLMKINTTLIGTESRCIIAVLLRIKTNLV
jgi:hypothetical protein